jgi:hypothetical protein
VALNPGPLGTAGRTSSGTNFMAVREADLPDGPRAVRASSVGSQWIRTYTVKGIIGRHLIRANISQKRRILYRGRRGRIHGPPEVPPRL